MKHFCYIAGCAGSPRPMKEHSQLKRQNYFSLKKVSKVAYCVTRKTLEFNSVAPDICIFFFFFECSSPKKYYCWIVCVPIRPKKFRLKLIITPEYGPLSLNF